MATEPLLTPACELAFAVARDGLERSPVHEPPAPMRSFLYVAQLPRRALTVAQRVIDEDPAFRQRVAERASEEEVGRAGWLWLHRPEGWEAELSSLTGRPPVTATVGRVLSGDHGDQRLGPPSLQAPRPHEPTPLPGPAPAPLAGGSSLAERVLSSDIERELDGLRSLVDRLADERRAVSTSVQELESEIQQRRSETSQLADHLDLLRAELDDATRARDALAGERDQARAELEASRRQHREVDAELAAARGERDGARAELAGLSSQLEQLRAELRDLRAQREGFRSELQRVADEHAETSAAQRALLEELSTHLRRMESERDELAGELQQANARLEGTRLAIARAAEQAAAELDSVIPSLTSASETTRLLGGAVVEAAGRLVRLQDTIAAPTPPGELHIPAAEPGGAEPAGGEQPHAEGAGIGERADGEGGWVGEHADAHADADADAAIQAGGAPAPWAAEPADEATGDEPTVAPALLDPFAGFELFERSAEALEAELAAAEGAGSGPLEDPDHGTDAAEREGAEDATADDVPVGGWFDGDAPAAAPWGVTPVENADVDADAGWPTADDAEETDHEAAAWPVAGQADAPDRDGAPWAVTPGPGDAERSGAAGEAGEAQDGTTGVDDLDWDSLLEPTREPWTNPGAGEAGARRVVEVPEDLRHDPLGVARFLVGVADVVVLVDGDAVAGMGWPTLSVAERRDALVAYLGDLEADTGAAPDVVFDVEVGGEEDLPQPDAVRVRLTAPDVSPARALGELVDTYPVDWPVVVVTDDPGLQDDAAQRGAATLSNVQLLDLFIAQ